MLAKGLLRCPAAEMARKIRFTPDGGALYEVTCRTVHNRFLLRPGPLINEIIVGALGRAQRLFPLEICAFFFASGHFHLLLRVEDSERLAVSGGQKRRDSGGQKCAWDALWYRALTVSRPCRGSTATDARLRRADDAASGHLAVPDRRNHAVSNRR